MYFWNNLDRFSDSEALTNDSGHSLSYKELNEKIELFGAIFENRKNLIFLECKNSINCIAFYLASLRFEQPCLLIDEKLDTELKEQLLNTYNPNFVVKDDGEINITKRHGEKLDLEPELALLLSTSGTTGSPKLVKLSKENIHENASSISKYLKLKDSDKAITLLPLQYSYGLSIINSHMLIGGSLVVTEKGLFDKDFWHLIKDNAVTSLSGVPYIYEMLKRLRFERMDLPSLRYMTQAGGKLSGEMVKEYGQLCARKNIQFYVMYGQTEATARISYLEPNMALKKSNSIGKAIPNGELILIDDNNNKILEKNIEGQLVYDGPNVMLGYATSLYELASSGIRNTILMTGDLAFFDDDGDFYITGRLKRFIKMYGLRLNLDKIESDLRNEGFECACGGQDDNLCVATINEDLLELKSAISENYKINKNNIFIFKVSELARTSSGKINYKEIFK